MKLQLLSGAYQAKSLIASAQRCLNLYPEVNQRENAMAMPELAGASAIITHYPTPGLTLLAASSQNVWRGLYVAGNGVCYGVCGANVYLISPSFTLTLLGTIADGVNPVSMSDNGIDLILVDGTVNGYVITLATNAFALLVDGTGSFVGADTVDYLDTFFLFNKPGSQSFYVSLSNSITFDPLYIANKTGRADNLVNLIVCRREIMLIGNTSTEIWYDAGGANFPFQVVAGAFIEHGCVAKYSIARSDITVFFLSQDGQGQSIVLAASNYNAERISTHAIESEIQGYAVVSDAIGHVHQMEGHTFYVLSFPTADRTWVYDLASGLWHERGWMDANGVVHRVRANVGMHYNGVYLVGDWENGNMYKYDPLNFADNGQPILRLRSFPHVVNELKRMGYKQFIADMQSGGSTDPTVSTEISLRFSDDRGASWGNYITQSMGNTGQGITSLQWQRLGMARDRVFELSWSSPVATALNGAFISVQPSAS